MQHSPSMEGVTSASHVLRPGGSCLGAAGWQPVGSAHVLQLPQDSHAPEGPSGAKPGSKVLFIPVCELTHALHSLTTAWVCLKGVTRSSLLHPLPTWATLPVEPQTVSFPGDKAAGQC